jgi:glucokinase
MTVRIGIDIGGTQLRVAALDEKCNILKRTAFPNVHSAGPEENLGRLVDAIEGWGLDYEGIGIGCPGPLDFEKGQILTPPNLPGWEGFPVADFFRRRCDHPCHLNNDANVAGLAEALVGAGRNFSSVVYITVSTGVGAAYVQDGKIVGGAHSLATEVFNMIVCDAPVARPGMNPGALEDQSSGTAIARMASERMGREVTAPAVFALADAGNADALAVIDHAAECLARGVNNINAVVDPDVFVFGGSVALKNPAFLDMVYQKAKGYVLDPDALLFSEATCGDDAGLVGASLLV